MKTGRNEHLLKSKLLMLELRIQISRRPLSTKNSMSKIEIIKQSWDIQEPYQEVLNILSTKIRMVTSFSESLVSSLKSWTT